MALQFDATIKLFHLSRGDYDLKHHFQSTCSRCGSDRRTLPLRRKILFRLSWD